jgi:hypothetical protein
MCRYSNCIATCDVFAKYLRDRGYDDFWNRLQPGALCAMRPRIRTTARSILTLWLVTVSACQNGTNTTGGGPVMSAQELRPNTTICEIAMDPQRFIGKRVVVDGCITSDGQEYTVLTQVDGHCDAGGMSPGMSPDYRPTEWVYPKPDEKACGTFAGVFRGPDMLNSRVLEIGDAQNVRIVPLTQ